MSELPTATIRPANCRLVIHIAELSATGSMGFQAAATNAPIGLSLASPGCQRSNIDRSVPSSVRVRVCSRRCAPLWSNALLTLGEALADDGVHRAFGQAGRDALAGAVSLAVVDQAAGVAGDVDGELVGGAHECRGSDNPDPARPRRPRRTQSPCPAFGILLSPIVAALAILPSSVSVIGNALSACTQPRFSISWQV